MRKITAFTLSLLAMVLATSQLAYGLPVTGAVAWYDASDVDGDGDPGNNPINGASISSWADKASTVQGAQNAVQGTGSMQPTYVVSAQNGQSALNFSADVLVAPGLNYGTFTYFSVFRTSGPTAIVYERSATENSNPGEYFVTSTNSTLAVNRGGPHSHYNYSTNWAHTGNFLTATHRFDGTHATHSMLVDGSTVALANHIVGDPGTGTITESLYIGARSGATVALSGDLSELFVYGTALNTAEINITNNYLASKYDTPLSAPLDHYAGDTNGNGDYDSDVFGIGRDDASNILGSSSSAGLTIEDNGSTLSDGDFLLAGHNVQSNALTTLGVPAGEAARMQRVWYLDRTDIDDSLVADLTFDFSDAGITLNDIESASLLYSPTDAPYSFSILGGLITSIGDDSVTFTIPAGTLADGYYTIGVTAQVPEPSSFMLLGLGTLALIRNRRRRTHQRASSVNSL